MDSSDEDLIVIGACMQILKKKKVSQKRRKRFWIHEIYSKRTEEGEFHTLFERLKNDPTKFFKYFRMSIQEFELLLSLVESDIVKQNSKWRSSIRPDERLALCLRFLASGDSQISLSFSYRISPTAVDSIIKSTCESIWKRLSPVELPTPTKEMWKRISSEFFSLWQFPNCIGAIDGKHIEIIAPQNSGSLFYNYKKTFSVVLLAIVDANYRFVLVDVGGYGKYSDGGIYSHSTLGKYFDSDKLNVPVPEQLPNYHEKLPYVLVGDESFPLKTYLLRPYSGKTIGEDETKRVFNYRLSRARRVVENEFGILVQKFRVFYKKIQMKPENVDKVVLAACALHNFLRNDSVPSTLDNEETSDETLGLTNFTKYGARVSREALTVRDGYKCYFNSDTGSVPWQLDSVRRGKRN